MPSPIDSKACAHFMGELLELGKVQREQARLAVVANRVRENTLMFEELDEYLGKLKVPYLSALRQSTNYLRAFQRGMGVFELPEYLARPDWKQWEPITKWLGSKKSQPAKRLALWRVGALVRSGRRRALILASLKPKPLVRSACSRKLCRIPASISA